MKTRIFLFIGLTLLICSAAMSKESVTGNIPSRNGSVNVFTSPDLYALTVKWTTEYSKINPSIKINVVNSSDKNIAAILNTEEGIGILTNESYAGLNHQATWNMVVGRDVIVPVMNMKNPLWEEINRKGITQEGLSRLFSATGNLNWGLLLGNGDNIPVHCYIMNNASVKSGISNFLNKNLPETNGISVATRQEMIAAIQKDPNGIGFCKLIDVIDLKNQNLVDDIKLVPIDKNGNGKIDFMEDIYDNLQTFSRGVWIGKYPKALSGNIFAVASSKPGNETEVAFLRWVMNDGQQFLGTNGFSDLVYSERQTQLDKLNTPVIYVAARNDDSFATIKVVIMVLITFCLIGLVMNSFARRLRNKKGAVSQVDPAASTVFDENSVNIPQGLFFDKTHTWAFMEKDGRVKIGIDDFLQHLTGPLTSIGMKPAGVKIKKGEPLLTIIQKGKHLIIYSPVSGTITAYNQTLITNSSAINTAPYSDGWVYMIEPTNWLREIQFLSMAEKYKTWLKGEFLRAKDFFATAMQVNSPEFAYVALQDGGTLKNNILADLGPEIWEDFQTKFIDLAK